MASSFDQAFENSAAPLFDEWFGTEIQLRRGTDTSSEFTAVWSSQEYKSLEHETGLAIIIKRRVYRFLKADAVISDATVEPRAGDEIIDGSETMRILGMGDLPAVEEDPGAYRWLVRTDKVA